MEQGHAIDFALDLARWPALARTSVAPALPPNILELIRIAAACPEACEAAAARTGEPTAVLIEAARFYLQQVLFRPEADCYRILGIKPADSRETARNHMRWLLEWLHPDRNNNSWDAVYAERVLKAWREVSSSNGSAAEPNLSLQRVSPSRKKGRRIQTVRLPWIKQPTRRSPVNPSSYRALIIWLVAISLVTVFLALWSASILLRP